MAVTIDGTTGVSLVQDGVITDANLPAGSVLQIVRADYSTTDTFSSTSYAETGLSATITPSSSSSKILVMVKQFFTFWTATTDGAHALVKLTRTGSGSGTQLMENNYDFRTVDNASTAKIPMIASLDCLDSPGTTNSLTYTTQYRLLDSTNITLYGQNNQTPSTILLMEIAG